MLLASRVISILNNIVVWWSVPLQDVVKYQRTHLWQLIHASLLNYQAVKASPGGSLHMIEPLAVAANLGLAEIQSLKRCL